MQDKKSSNSRTSLTAALVLNSTSHFRKFFPASLVLLTHYLIGNLVRTNFTENFSFYGSNLRPYPTPLHLTKNRLIASYYGSAKAHSRPADTSLSQTCSGNRKLFHTGFGLYFFLYFNWSHLSFREVIKFARDAVIFNNTTFPKGKHKLHYTVQHHLRIERFSIAHFRIAFCLCQNESKWENILIKIDLKTFVQGLVLKQRQKATRKIKSKVITLANHKEQRQSNEPIKTPRKLMLKFASESR